MIGLGYVGLPLALEFARYFRVLGFDISEDRVALMQQGKDPSRELSATDFQDRDIKFTTDEEALKECIVYIVAVPTDINEAKVPNLNPLEAASRTVASTIERGNYVIYESTVYPGCTEEICLPIIEELSGLQRIEDFKFGYSPERINPGDKERTVATILKIVSGCDKESLDTIAQIYGRVITAGVYKAEGVKVAEAAKVIENTQRDLNISLMNELAMVFDKLGIETEAVLNAAGTKWNFVKLRPGLVGGHCIGVDPYYLLHKARQVNIEPQVIAAGRRINDQMPEWIAKKIVTGIADSPNGLTGANILIMGVTFKENVSDIRNSKVIDLISALKAYDLNVDTIDPYVNSKDIESLYSLKLVDKPVRRYRAIVIAVAHDKFIEYSQEQYIKLLEPSGSIYDLKGTLNWGKQLGARYWKL